MRFRTSIRVALQAVFIRPRGRIVNRRHGGFGMYHLALLGFRGRYDTRSLSSFFVGGQG